jgi:hypothetical protein
MGRNYCPTKRSYFVNTRPTSFPPNIAGDEIAWTEVVFV